MQRLCTGLALIKVYHPFLYAVSLFRQKIGTCKWEGRKGETTWRKKCMEQKGGPDETRSKGSNKSKGSGTSRGTWWNMISLPFSLHVVAHFHFRKNGRVTHGCLQDLRMRAKPNSDKDPRSALLGKTEMNGTPWYSLRSYSGIYGIGSVVLRARSPGI